MAATCRNLSSSIALAVLMLVSVACTTGSRSQAPRLAGMVTASLDARGTLRTEAQGCAVFAEDGRTCLRTLSPYDPIRVASISKLVVALGALRVVEQGKLALDRDVSQYLGFTLRNPHYPITPITLRQLLSHTSSLMDGDGYALTLGKTVRDDIAHPSHWDRDHTPGSYFVYANYNFVIIATAMEAATGERFDRLMQRLVLTPLKIDGCFGWALCSASALERAAVLYRTGADETQWQPDGRWIAQVDDLNGHKPACPVRLSDASQACDLAAYVPGTNGALFSPQGGLRISVADLSKIMALVLGDGSFEGVRLLKRSSIEAMLSPQWTFDPTAGNGDSDAGRMCAYGLSIQLMAIVHAPTCRDDLFGDGRPRAGHLGEAYGLLGGLWMDIPGKRGMIYLITGTADDPNAYPGRSAFSRAEEAAVRAP